MSKLICHAYLPDTGIFKDPRAPKLFVNAVAGNDYAFDDELGHGTMTASVIAQQSDAELVIYNHSPKGKHDERIVFDIMPDIERRIRAAPKDFHLISTSFHDKQTPDSALGQEIDYWGKRLVEKFGAMWTTSAANDGKEITDIIIPAGFYWATVFSALDKNKRTLADYSNWGKTVDFCAPGYQYVRTLNGWSYRDGTSFATPYGAAQAFKTAQYLHESGINLTPHDMDVYNAMLALSVDLGDKGYDPYYGHGRVDTDNLPVLLTVSLQPAWVPDTEPEPTPEPDKEEETPVSTARQFYNKARQCVGGLYGWGEQGAIMTEAHLRARAAKYPEYFNGGRLEMMIARIKADPTLRAWDCSGLICWALAQIGAVKSDFDTTAQGLYANYCTKLTAPELPGDLMFRYSGGKMVHVGIYAPGACVEAAGGAYGVVECKGLTGTDHTAKSHVDGKVHQLPGWTHYGRLKMLEAAAPEPAPEPEPAGAPIFAFCTGASVNVRSGPGTENAVVAVAHKGDKFTARATANGWYRIAGFVGDDPVVGYMSGKYIEEA